MLSSTSRRLTRLLAVLYGVLGIVLFIVPGWAANNFSWKISSLVAMTMGGWCLGNAIWAWETSRVWRWSIAHPCLIYLWSFGVSETLVLFLFRDAVRLREILAWPYFLVLGVNLLAAVVGVIDWLRLRPKVMPAGAPMPWWARGMVVVFILFVLFVGGGAALANKGGLATEGGIFPDKMSLFTVRAFAAFYLSLVIGIVPVLFARGIEPLLIYMRTGIPLIVSITAAALLHADLFDFSTRSGGLLYLGSYLAAFVGALAILAYGWSHGSTAGMPE